MSERWAHVGEVGDYIAVGHRDGSILVTAEGQGELAEVWLTVAEAGALAGYLLAAAQARTVPDAQSTPEPDARADAAVSDGATVRKPSTGETYTRPASPPYMADTMRPDVSLPGEPPEVSMARRDWMAAQHGAAYNGWRPEYPAPVEALRAWLDAGEPLTYPDACALLDEVVYLRGAGGPPASQPEIRGGERAVQTYMTTQRGGGWVAPPVESWAALVTHVDTAVGHRWTLYNACLDEGGYWRGWGDGGIFPGEEIGPFWLLRRPDAQAPTSQPEPPPQPRGGEAHADPCPTCSAPRAVGCWCKGGE